MTKWRRGLAGLLVVTLLLVLATALAAWVYTRRASPQIDGRLTMPGLAGEVRIERDQHGIPTVRAGNLRDLMFGLGVVHAQDRLWQLETHKRIGAGRLAEAFGTGGLETDRFLRALGVRRAAQAQWAQARGEAREVLEAYAAGINARVRLHTKARPPEMLILGVEPEDWTPVDSLSWATMMAWDLGGNWGSELLRLRLALTLPQPAVARIDQLLPPYPGEAPLATRDYAALFRGLKLDAGLAQAERLDRLFAAAPSSGIEGAGSNNWVVAGSRSATGAPLLANDPHLKLSAPALWYLARLEAPGFKVAGATMPGLPGVVLGQNEHIAWGYTNTGPDVQDLYLERVKPGDPTQYQTPDGWAAFTTFDEVIRVKGGADVPLRVRATRHGPVISDAGVADDALGTKGGSRDKAAYVLAMRWTALDADAESVGVGLAFNRARSVAEFVAASRVWVAPMQNMVVADRAGRIGMVAPGRVPLRGPAHDLKGLVPAPGWEARYDWVGSLPADETPREFDPPRGWIATANQRVTPAGYPHFITSEWAAPYRQQRIEQLLAAQPAHSIDSLRAIQADVLSLAAAPLLPWLQRAATAHPLEPAARRELQGFDGRMAADRGAPLIYWAWVRQLTSAVFADELGPLYERSIGGRSFRDALEGVLARDDAWWCDDKTTPQASETCTAQAGLAYTRALEELQESHGSDVARWRWGDAHQARAEHRPFSRVKPLARWFELRAPVGGDTHTVNVSRVGLKADATTGEFYLDEHGPSLRALYDVGDPSRSRFMQSSGQSGLPWSRWYRAFVGPWARVEDVAVWTDGAVAHTLVLVPQSR